VDDAASDGWFAWATPVDDAASDGWLVRLGSAGGRCGIRRSTIPEPRKISPRRGGRKGHPEIPRFSGSLFDWKMLAFTAVRIRLRPTNSNENPSKYFGGRALAGAGLKPLLGERSSPALPRVAPRLAECLRHERRCGPWVFDRAAGLQARWVFAQRPKVRAASVDAESLGAVRREPTTIRAG